MQDIMDPDRGSGNDKDNGNGTILDKKLLNDNGKRWEKWRYWELEFLD